VLRPVVAYPTLLTSVEAGRIDAAITTRLAGASYTAPANADVAAIKAKTDNLPAAPAAVGDIPTAAGVASQVRTELTTELGRVDAAITTRLAGASYTAPANADVAAIKAKTDNLPADPADQSAVEAAIAAISTITVADILAGVVEGSITLQQTLRVVLAFVAGKASGGGTAAPSFRDQADTKNRIALTVDESGNRSAVTLDLS
jgi:hypothetical protein